MPIDYDKIISSGNKKLSKGTTDSINYDEILAAGKPGKMETIGRGLAHGLMGMGESAFRGTQYLGERVGSPALTGFGKKVGDFAGSVAERYGPPEEIAGKNVFDNPEILAKSSYWLYNVADMVPTLAASMVPAAAAGKVIQIAGKAYAWTPQLASRLIKLGQWTTGFATGGGLEAAQTYKTVLQEGGSEEEAARSAEGMFLGAGFLNAVGTGKLLNAAGGNFKSKIVNRLGAAAWEGLTEGAEEPTEVFAKLIGKYLSGEPLPEDITGELVQSLKEAATVAPIAAVTGLGGAAVSGEGQLKGLDVQGKREEVVSPVEEDIQLQPAHEPTTAMPFSPLQAAKLKRMRSQKALPPGQGFELIGEPYAETIRRDEGQDIRKESKELEEAQQGREVTGKPTESVLQRGPEEGGETVHREIQEPKRKERRSEKAKRLEGEAVANVVNVEVPGNGLKYDGVQEGVEDMPSVHQFTATEGEVKDVTFYTESLDPQEVQGALERKIEEFKPEEIPKTPAIPEQEKAVEQERAKEPWEMAQVEFYENKDVKITPSLTKSMAGKPAYKYTAKYGDKEISFVQKSQNINRATEILHKKFVEQALSEGKPVPAEVLKDYPDLTPPASTEAAEKKEAPAEQDPAEMVSKSGRKLSPYPDKKIWSDRTAKSRIKEPDEWLIKEAIAEAESTGDDYNATIFKGELPISKNGLPQASRDSANVYLFGREEVKFERPEPTKPVAEEPTKSEAKEAIGRAWYKNQQKPIMAARKITKGKHKGMVEITMTRGRDIEGKPVAGLKRKVKESEIIEWPGEEKAEVAPKVKKPRVERSDITLGTYIKNRGGINYLNFKGELKELPPGIRIATARKGGVPIDFVEQDLKSEGYLKPDESLLEVFRTEPKALSRRKATRDVESAKKLTEQEKRVKKEMEREVEGPPEGKYETVTVDELKDGENYTIIEGRTADGWDEYKVIKTKDGVTLEDGQVLKLDPWDQVEVLVKETEIKGEKQTAATSEDILKEALRWQGAHINSEIEFADRGDKRGQYQIAKESGKSELDSYLMKKFGIDRSAAHEISNDITARNLKPDKTATADNFSGEKWADDTISAREKKAEPNGKKLSREKFADTLIAKGLMRPQDRGKKQYAYKFRDAIPNQKFLSANEIYNRLWKPSVDARRALADDLKEWTDADLLERRYRQDGTPIYAWMGTEPEAESISDKEADEIFEGKKPEPQYINSTKGKIEVKTPAELTLRQDNYGKQRPDQKGEAVKKQETLGLVVKDKQQPELFEEKPTTEAEQIKVDMPNRIDAGIKRIEALDEKRREFNRSYDAILSTSAMGQAPPALGTVLDKALKVAEKQAKIWNEIRSLVVGDKSETLWQIALKSKNLITVQNGEESRLDFYGSDLRSVIEDYLEEKPTTEKAGEKLEDFGEKIGGARKDTAERGQAKPKIEKPESGEPAWRKKYIAMEKVDGSGWSIGKKGDTWGLSARRGEVFATQEEAEKAIPLYAVAESHRVYERDGEWSIFKMVGKRKLFKVVNKTFPSREEGMKYMALHAEELLNTKTTFGEEILPVPEIATRKGPERRTTDATPEMFMETFAPRGIEFGNWNNQEERQQVLNHSYDGLLDLADVLNVPPKALMLNGELAIAFGARGQGLTGAKAHYEKDYGVINLTKMKGAGSLAHEWLHALDHYLARQDTKSSSEKEKNKRGDLVYKTKSDKYDFLSHGASYKSQLRPEVKEAYDTLIKTMFTKAKEYVEDMSYADKFLRTAKNNLKSEIERVRTDLEKDLTKSVTWRKSKKGLLPASAEQLVEFDNLANTLMEGGNLETKFIPSEAKGRKFSLSGRHSNETLDAISTIYKAVRNRTGFDTQNHAGILDRVSAAMGTYSQRLKLFEDAQKGTTKKKKVPTSYAVEAKKMDQARTGDYWGQPNEMAARAFAAYVEDKIAEKGGQSDFIVYHAHGGILLPMIDGFVAKPYPEGQERIDINKAFDDFISILKTKETEKGTALYSLKDALKGGTVTLKDIQSFFKGQRVGLSPDGNVWVRTKSGHGLQIKSVQSISEDKAAFNIAYGRQRRSGEFIAGKYESGTIELQKDISDRWTLAHESFHWLSDIGLISEQDINQIDRKLKRQGIKNPSHEDRAEWFEKNYQSRSLSTGLKRIVQKIQDFIDSLVNLFKRTARGVVRDVESGKVFEGKGTGFKTVVPAYEKTAQRWYSQMEQFLAEKLPGKGTGKSYLDTINSWAKKGLIKSDELEWSGLMAYLDNYQTEKEADWVAEQKEAAPIKKELDEDFTNYLLGEIEDREISSVRDKIIDRLKVQASKQTFPISKQDVLDYLAASNVRVEEVEKGAKRTGLPVGWTVKKITPGYFGVYDEDGYSNAEGNTKEEAIQNALDTLSKEGYGDIKFSQYQLPGGEGYRELLLTLPVDLNAEHYARSKRIKELLNKRDNLQSQLNEAGETLGRLGRQDQINDLKRQIRNTNTQINMISSEQQTDIKNMRTAYKSDHWDEPNVLAHIRFNERTGPNGEKVLFIEEVQSDWHQKGRKKGYGTGKEKRDKALKELELRGESFRSKLSQQGIETPEFTEAGASEFYRTLQTDDRLSPEHRQEIHDILQENENLPSYEEKGVPQAPFKKTWPLLALKRMVRYAAENGYDSVAWTPGEVHFERWGSEEVAWEKQGDGWRVYASAQTGGRAGGIDIENEARIRGLLNERKMRVNTKDQLERLVNEILSSERTEAELKKITDRVWDRMQTEDIGTSLPRKEGFEGYYDKILPAEVNKFFNKATWGKAKVEVGNLSTPDTYMQDTFKNARIEKYPSGKFGVFATNKETGKEIATGSYETLKDAEHYRDIINEGKGQEVWSLPITPEMKSKALREGMPLFQAKKLEKEFVKDIEYFAGNFKESKADVSITDRAVGLPIFHFKKVKALQGIFKAGLEWMDDKVKVLRSLIYNENDEAYNAMMDSFRKSQKAEWKKWNQYLIDRDVNGVGYKVEQDLNNPSNWRLFNTEGKEVGQFKDEELAWAEARELEAAEYLENSWATEQGAENIKNFRIVTRNIFKQYRSGIDRLIEKYKERGEEPPTITYRTAEGNAEISLEAAMAKMGDRQGYYVPRLRTSGRLVLIATKEGEHPIREHFDFGFMNTKKSKYLGALNYPAPVMRKFRKLKRKGYDVTIEKSDKMPEDVFLDLAGQRIAMSAIINKGLEGVGQAVRFKLSDIGLSGKWAKKDYEVTGKPTKEIYRDILKDLGGEYYYKVSSKHAGPTWIFKDAAKDIETQIKEMIYETTGINQDLDLIFAGELANQIANIEKSRGSLSRTIGRTDTRGKDVWKGYEEDVIIALTKTAQAAAGGEAKRVLAEKMVKLMTGTTETWTEYKKRLGKEAKWVNYKSEVDERRIDPTRQEHAYKEGMSYMENLLRNDEAADRVLGSIKGLAVLKYLGFRVAAPAVNLTALATTVPATMTKHGIPLRRVPKYLGSAMKAYGAYRRGNAKDDWKKIFDVIHENGWHKAQYNKEALAVLKTKAGRGWDNFLEASMWMFGATEQLNRISTIAGAAKAFMDKGIDFDTAINKAKEDVSDVAHGVYGKSNYPAMARGGGTGAQIVRSFYVFRTFSHHYLLNLKEMVGDKQYKAALFMTLSPAILAGAGASILMPIVSMIGKMFGMDDPEEEFYRWAQNNFGDDAEGYLRTGLLYPANANLKGSLEIGIFDVPTSFKELLGAPGSMVSDMYEGGKSIIKGKTWKGIEKAMPINAAASMMKAVREAKQGVTTSTDAPVFYGNKPLKPSTLDSVLRFFSFNPASLSEKRERQWKEKKVAYDYTDRRTDIYAKIKRFYALPATERSREKWAEIIADIEEYNERALQAMVYVPRITGKSIRTNLRRSFTPPKRERMRAVR